VDNNLIISSASQTKINCSKTKDITTFKKQTNIKKQDFNFNDATLKKKKSTAKVI